RDGHITPEMVYQRNSAIKDISTDELKKVFPSPVSYKEIRGTFVIDKKTTIQSDPEFLKEAELFANDLKAISGKKPLINSGREKSEIVFRKVNGLKKEAYELKVTAEQVEVSASEA